MKVVSLNTEGGERGEIFFSFLRQHPDVDVWCFQEVWNGGEHMLQKEAAGRSLANRKSTLLRDIQEVLPEYRAYFRPNFYDFYGLAVFVRSSITVLDEGERYIYREAGFVSDVNIGDHARILQYVTLETPQGPCTVVHLHGMWNGKGKEDSDERLEQSRRILSFVSERSEPVCIVGDFNLNPDTESIICFEQAGFDNLIKRFGITSTRTSFYTWTNRYADYAFVSPSIEVNDFKVLPEEVSDHAPLYVDFSLS